MPRTRRFERDNVANEIVEDSRSEHHYVSFEFYPFHEGMTFAVYKGLLSTEARKGKTFCVVKALLDRDMVESSYLSDTVRKSIEAQRLAVKFNALVGYEAISFQVPFLGRVQCVSDFSGLFRCVVPHEKRLSRDELVLVEEYIDDDFIRFNTSNGTVPKNRCDLFAKHNKINNESVENSSNISSRSKSRNGISNQSSVFDGTITNKWTKFESKQPSMGVNNLAQAFTHFTWHETKQLVVCDLKGVSSGNCYFLSNPTIHSLDSSFGATDGGCSAISQVLTWHRCTNVCQDWNRYSTGSANDKNQINFLHNSNLQSASESSSSTNQNDLSVSMSSCKDTSMCNPSNNMNKNVFMG